MSFWSCLIRLKPARNASIAGCSNAKIFPRTIKGVQYQHPNDRPKPKAVVIFRNGSLPMHILEKRRYQQVLSEIAKSSRKTRSSSEIPAEIIREADNPIDSNTIRIEIDGKCVGYIPTDQARRLSLQMSEDGIDRAKCLARIRGGWQAHHKRSGLYGLTLAIPRNGWVDFGLGKMPPGYRKPTSSAPTSRLKNKKIALIGVAPTSTLALELANEGAHIVAHPDKESHYAVIAAGAEVHDHQKPAHWELARARRLIDDGASMIVLSEDDFRTHLSEIALST